MRFNIRTLMAGLVTVLLLAAVAALSQLPYAVEPGDRSLIRLSWRARGERVEECRQLSEAEQQALARHMRRTEVCEGRIASYRLHAELDGVVVVDDTVHGSGARQDRPLYVYHDLPVAPGTHSLYVTFARLGAASAETDSRTVPPRLELETRVDATRREIVLITYDPDRRALVVRESVGPDSSTG